MYIYYWSTRKEQEKDILKNKNIKKKILSKRNYFTNFIFNNFN